MSRISRFLKFLGFDVSTRKDSYNCPYCGFIIRKKDALVSGYDSESSLRHIHCPKCGKIITYLPA